MSLFVTFEGIDGAGKTTLQNLLTQKLDKYYNILSLREPGGTKISEDIRNIILDSTNLDMHNMTELLLFSAARCQIVNEVIVPALKNNIIVFLDRYIDSTLAYQGYGKGISLYYIDLLNTLSTGNLTPNLTILLDIDIETSYQRTVNKNKDRMEINNDFLAKTRDGYLQLQKENPHRIKLLDGSKSLDQLMDETIDIIFNKINKGEIYV